MSSNVVVLTDLWSNPALAPVDLDLTQDLTEHRSNRYAAPPARRTRVTSRLREEVVTRYRRGETSREVAEACGIGKTTVLTILKQAGVAVRRQGMRY